MLNNDPTTRIIRTFRKEKLPKGFLYPFSAAKISSALDGIPQFDEAALTFMWRDEYRASKWQKRVQAKGVVTLFEFEYHKAREKFEFLQNSERWSIFLYAVPSQYSMLAREHLRLELHRVKSELSAAGSASRSFQSSIAFDLSEAEKKANHST